MKSGSKRADNSASLRRKLARAERRLREVEQRHDLVMHGLHEGVYDWDLASGKLTYSDHSNALGLPPGTIKAVQDWVDFIHPDDREGYRLANIAHFKGLTPRFECDYRYRARDGSWRWARTHGMAIRDKDGRAVRVIGSTGDITDFKRAEEALRTSEERYALATSAAAEGIYEWDLPSGRLFVTERAKALFSLPAEALTTAAWNNRIHPEDFAGYRQAIIDHFKQRTPRLEHEYRLGDGDGGYRWVHERGIGVRDAGGRVVRMVGALSDITRRKRALKETEETLEQQTAIAEILAITARSPSDVQPVFEAIARNAVRLCGGAHCAVFRFDGRLQHFAAHCDVDPETVELLRSRYPRSPDPERISGKAILAREVIHLADALSDERYPGSVESLTTAGNRAVLAVPMLKAGEPIGVIFMVRRESRRFSERQVALLKTFADQAVIAIENVRLFNETREALEQQTATREILEITARSPSDVQPVFDAIARAAVRLCDGAHCSLYQLEDSRQVPVAHHGLAPEMIEHLERRYRRVPHPQTVSGHAILRREVVHLEDARLDQRFPESHPTQRLAGDRAVLAVPMLKDGQPAGVILVGRREPRPFSDRQIALLKTFADQAVIAVENVRLINETREALAQQKALAEVLGSISSSIADTKPVFDLILDSCQRLFEGHLVGLTLAGDDGRVRLGAYRGENKEAMEAVYPYPLGRDSGSGQCILDRRVVHFPDVDAPGSDAPPRVLHGSQASGFKAIIFAPLLDEGHGIGALWVGRREPGPFSERQSELLKSFADQAVIAIRNARLFSEIREKGRQLETANRHKSQFLANMSHELRTPLNAILGFARIVARHSQGKLEAKQLENLDKISASGQHLLALINAILDLAKVEAGRVEVQPAEVELAPVLEQCLRTVEPLVKVALVKEFDGALPSMHVDEEKLRQIVLNLLSNAAKFTERGTIRLQARSANGSVAIAVADTGIGIPDDKLGLIFQEFEQVDASITRAHGGTGLGLAIAQRLARLMGGDIAVESTLGRGSTFTLSLPLRYSE